MDETANVIKGVISMTSFFGVNDSFFGTDTTYSANNNMLGDFSMIKNGTYKKLLNAYYAKKSDQSTDETEDSSEKKSEKTKLLQTKTQAETLKKAADDLKNGKVFEGTVDEATGKVTYDREEITKKLTSFVDAYNDMLDSSSDVDTKSVLQKTLWMIGNTKANSSLLSKVGISIGKDNKLTLDKDKVKEADINSLKVLFSGKGSLSDKVSSKSTEIGNLANSAIKSLGNKGSAYTNTGNYNDLTTSTLYNGLF